MTKTIRENRSVMPSLSRGCEYRYSLELHSSPLPPCTPTDAAGIMRIGELYRQTLTEYQTLPRWSAITHAEAANAWRVASCIHPSGHQRLVRA